jgi:hypothetical protein
MTASTTLQPPTPPAPLPQADAVDVRPELQLPLYSLRRAIGCAQLSLHDAVMDGNPTAARAAALRLARWRPALVNARDAGGRTALSVAILAGALLCTPLPLLSMSSVALLLQQYKECAVCVCGGLLAVRATGEDSGSASTAVAPARLPRRHRTAQLCQTVISTHLTPNAPVPDCHQSVLI